MFKILTSNGPYLFVIKSCNNYIFGGYCTVDIVVSNSCKYLSDPDAFTYVFKGMSPKREIYDTKKPNGKNAVFYNGYGYFFIFGPSGADIVIYPTWNEQTHICCRNRRDKNLWYKIPENQTLVGTKTQFTFSISEMEIFQIPQ
eukprot:UN05242